MASDSQGSDDRSESHGLQKLVPGADFLIGGTGAGDLVRTVNQRLVADYKDVNADNIAEYLPRVMAEDIRSEVWTDVEFVVAGEKQLLYYQPGRFLRPQQRPFAMAGSGAEFVRRAWFRDMELGIEIKQETLADTFVAVEGFLDAANESLTVDDKLMFGIVAGGRTYVMGHRDIYPLYIPPAVFDKWNLVAQKYEEMRTMAVQIRAEFGNAQTNLSSIRIAQFGTAEAEALNASNGSISRMRSDLNAALQQYMGWYDGLLER